VLQAETIQIAVHDEDDDPATLDDLTHTLHQEIALIDAVDVRRASAESVVPGSKSGLITSLTTLLVSGGFSAAVVKSLTTLVQDWMKRSQARKVVLVFGENRLELEGASGRDQAAAVTAWETAVATAAPTADADG
jgi:hypothetical protein